MEKRQTLEDLFMETVEAAEPGVDMAVDVGALRTRPRRMDPSRNTASEERIRTMKFLAILKDSLREAVDTKVFYVMVGLVLPAHRRWRASPVVQAAARLSRAGPGPVRHAATVEPLGELHGRQPPAPDARRRHGDNSRV